jgi:hypothetical protein
MPSSLEWSPWCLPTRCLLSKGPFATNLYYWRNATKNAFARLRPSLFHILAFLSCSSKGSLLLLMTPPFLWLRA